MLTHLIEIVSHICRLKNRLDIQREIRKPVDRDFGGVFPRADEQEICKNLVETCDYETSDG